MSNKVQRIVDRKNKMEEKILKMQEEMKELERQAYEEVGRLVFKEWEIGADVDSEIVIDIISSLKEEAQKLLMNDNVHSGKNELEESKTQLT
ncbi:hypothetical protein [Sporosarcina sp. BP05]|uniref:hypothetical protein n=1 Tax=Sporosarcina sp. BP05 TaxID=2758726 RepID=UPI001644F474|nr:hypothetical protein [Sporosarcina sp. BP05]